MAAAGLPDGGVSLVAGGDRDELRELATQDGLVDLIIPRGGEGLKNALKEHATVPVIYAAAGQLPRVRGRDRRPRRRAGRSPSTPRCSGPGVCNAAETLLVHADVAAGCCRACWASCARRASSCASTAAPARSRAPLADSLGDATEEDWATEYLALIMAVKVVDSVDGGDRARQPLRHAATPRRS